ncbi:uncharacterized protein PHALS_03418 [Plasmopara halstedii]|uniref:Integrase zinc-binding domain-containing protein n=1 Tax=Plasmopara halstedii TaxID=4781 RepID=A0A0P1AY45_PLAHL|nr:uncharacterized protein PHALS_03418 [Plasmopara halstedii]CEG46734.1 hypothetical protein PHALS_03418 [Plasmopara halstedii]|eukprot:XP_024583103.1 hypothetical protein PHALS_03418 [Plasmopara halstedii]
MWSGAKQLWFDVKKQQQLKVINQLIYLDSQDTVRRLSIMAHPGVRRTQLVAQQWYYWSMDEDIRAYVQSCEACMGSKSST